MSGLKFDGGKPDYTLVPWPAMEEVVKVLGFGAQKYDRDNWRKVDNAKQRYQAAAFRHMAAYASGQHKDPETGLSHMAQVGQALSAGQPLARVHAADETAAAAAVQAVLAACRLGDAPGAATPMVQERVTGTM